MFFKKDDKDAKLEKAKALARIGIRAALRNNPQYAAGIKAFCTIANGDVGDTIADAVTEKLGSMDDQYLAADIRDALQVCGMPDFEAPQQLEIIKAICGLV